jgi:hypothetical protein
MALTRNQIIGAASSVCLLPSFILTVVPTLSRDLGMAVCMALGVVALPFLPFALRQCKDTGARALIIVLGAVVLLYNFSNALDALNRGHAAETGDARGRMAHAAALNTKINDLSTRKASTAGIEAAQKARDAECKTGQGRVCRTRETELASAHRVHRERVEAIEGELDKARDDLRKLGAVETTADPTATQLASLAGLFWTPAATAADGISTNRPVFKAWVVEFMGGLMPWILVTIFGTAKPLPKVKSRKSAKNEPSRESVIAWHKDRVVTRGGRSVRAGVALADYETWCKDKGLAPVNQKEFGLAVKDELGIQKKDSGKRTSYVGIGLMKIVPPSDPRQTPVKRPGMMGMLGRLVSLPVKRS